MFRSECWRRRSSRPTAYLTRKKPMPSAPRQRPRWIRCGAPAPASARERTCVWISLPSERGVACCRWLRFVLTRLLSRWLAQAKADFKAYKAPEQPTTPAKQAVPDSGGSSSRGIAASACQGSVIHGGQGQQPPSMIHQYSSQISCTPPFPRDVVSRRTQGTPSDDLARRAAASFSDEAPRLVALQKVQPYAISVTAKLRTAADIQRAKNLVYEQRIEGKVLSEQDKTWLDDYHEGIRSQQDAALRATEVKNKSATANATGIMSMEVAVLRFSEDGTHGEMDIVLQQTTLSLVESHQQGSMTRAVETLVQCAQKNGSVWDVNRVSI